MLRVTGRLVTATCVLLIAAVATAAPRMTGADAQESAAFGPPADTVLLGQLSPVDVAIGLSEQTPFDDVDQVLIAREDTFADALASATLQATAPLLLVGSDAVPPQVLAHVSELDPDEVVLLGGPAALSDDVAASFADAGYQVTRRAGASRVETAIDIAATDASSATTAVLVRAFPAEGATDPTQAFADSLAAGGLAADNGWPVLLTQTETLTTATRNHLAGSAITEVVIVGGEAAVNAVVAAAVADLGIDVTRISGESRADTAVQVAVARGIDIEADGRVVLVDGEAPDGWVGGFAAAAHAGRFNAPILLAGSHGLLAQTRNVLDGEAASGPTKFRLVCTATPWACGQARQVLGLPQLTGHLLAADCDWSFGGPPRLSDDGRIVVISFPQQRCDDQLTTFQNAIAVVDTHTGQIRYIDAGEFAPSHLSLSAEGAILHGAGAVFDLRPDVPLILANLGAITDGFSVSRDGGTVAATEFDLEGFGNPFVGPGDGGEFYDVASGMYEGANSCRIIFESPRAPEDERTCSAHRAVSGDGRYVLNQYGHSPPDRSSYDLGFVRVARDGSHVFVPTPYQDPALEPNCGSALAPAVDGSTALAICERSDLVTIDYEAGTSTYVPLEDDEHGECSSFGISSMTAEGWISLESCDWLYHVPTGEIRVIDALYEYNSLSYDGRWLATVNQDGLHMHAFSDASPSAR